MLSNTIAQTLKVSHRCSEMQVLYGMRDKLAKVLVKPGSLLAHIPHGNSLSKIVRLLKNTAR